MICPRRSKHIHTVVQVLPPINTSWVRRRNKKGIFVCKQKVINNSITQYEYLYLNPTDTEFDESAKHLSSCHFISRATNTDLNQQAVIVWLIGSSKPFINIDSGNDYTVIWAPAKPELASRRTPFPPALRYTSIFPVSGWKLVAGSSVVTRHCIANPRFVIAS